VMMMMPVLLIPAMKILVVYILPLIVTTRILY